MSTWIKPIPITISNLLSRTIILSSFLFFYVKESNKGYKNYHFEMINIFKIKNKNKRRSILAIDSYSIVALNMKKKKNKSLLYLYLETSSHKGPFWLASLNLGSRRDLISRRVRVSCLGHLPVEASAAMHPVVSGVETLAVVVVAVVGGGGGWTWLVMLLKSSRTLTPRANIIISYWCCWSFWCGVVNKAVRFRWPEKNSSDDGIEVKWVGLGPVTSCLRSVDMPLYCCWWWAWLLWWSSIFHVYMRNEKARVLRGDRKKRRRWNNKWGRECE